MALIKYKGTNFSGVELLIPNKPLRGEFNASRISMILMQRSATSVRNTYVSISDWLYFHHIFDVYAKLHAGSCVKKSY